ncbi:MAG: RHS repeat-associated core domain-containing protein, partial [Cyclobacteriaceae bacterium]
VISYEEYYPFGSTSYWAGRSESEVKQKRYRYVGKEKDSETGLYYYGARYYAAWLCRFISVDPLKDEYPYYTSYQYAGNKPVTFIDLDGLEEAPGKLIQGSDNPIVNNSGEEKRKLLLYLDAQEKQKKTAKIVLYDFLKYSSKKPGATYLNQGTPRVPKKRNKPQQKKPSSYVLSSGPEDRFLTIDIKDYLDGNITVEEYNENLEARAYAGLAGVAVLGGGYLAASAGTAVVAEGSAFLAHPQAYLYLALSNPTTVETGIELTTDLFAPDGAPFSPSGGIDDAFKGGKSKGLKVLREQINPLNGNTNCVICAIALEKKFVSGLNSSASLTGPDANYLRTIKEAFPDAIKYNAYGGIEGLNTLLDQLSTKSAIVVGHFRGPYATSEVSSHAFNAIRQKDGSYKFLDGQSGKIWTNEEINQTFGRFDLINTRNN